VHKTSVGSLSRPQLSAVFSDSPSSYSSPERTMRMDMLVNHGSPCLAHCLFCILKRLTPIASSSVLH
jgi:hypothetical protein